MICLDVIAKLYYTKGKFQKIVLTNAFSDRLVVICKSTLKHLLEYLSLQFC